MAAVASVSTVAIPDLPFRFIFFAVLDFILGLLFLDARRAFTIAPFIGRWLGHRCGRDQHGCDTQYRGNSLHGKPPLVG